MILFSFILKFPCFSLVLITLCFPINFSGCFRRVLPFFRREQSRQATSTPQAIISVIGTDMERFPTDSHISSWAGLCPGDNESARKRKNGKTRKGNALLRETLVVCAHSAVRNKNSYFYAQFIRISAHRGKKRAYVAVAHSMLIAIYHILKDGVVFKDLGASYYNQFNKERKINAYLKKLKALGWEAPVVAT